MRQRVSVLIVQDGKLLMLWRSKNGIVYHTLIGGGMEAGETPEETAVREAKEETNLDIVLGPKLWAEEREGIVFDHAFLVTEFSGELCLGEGPERESASGDNIYRHVWVPLADVPNLKIFPTGVGAGMITAVLHKLSKDER